MESTGERMVPEKSDARTYWEHIYRYQFAVEFVTGKDVLDIACGEGYGSAAFLKARAKSVVGVDISPEACSHAKAKYGIDARPGDAMAIPLDDKSVDLIVSFETIEHVSDPHKFLSECARVLREKGRLVVSTPNREIYHHLTASNPFHCSEMSEPEFRNALDRHFQNVTLHAQCPTSARWWQVRGLLCDRWPWKRIPGVKRAIRFFLRIMNPHLFERSRESLQREPLGAILRKEGFLARATNPYAVTHHDPSLQLLPTYFVADAVKR